MSIEREGKRGKERVHGSEREKRERGKERERERGKERVCGIECVS